jgi:hypothetical protein
MATETSVSLSIPKDLREFSEGASLEQSSGTTIASASKVKPSAY